MSTHVHGYTPRTRIGPKAHTPRIAPAPIIHLHATRMERPPQNIQTMALRRSAHARRVCGAPGGSLIGRSRRWRANHRRPCARGDGASAREEQEDLASLRARLGEATAAIVDLTREVDELEARRAESGDGTPDDEIAELKLMLSKFWASQDPSAAELRDLPEAALDLLTATGYIRRDEWQDLHAKQKLKQKEGRAARDAAFHEVAEEVLSGAREDEATFPTDGQDPDDFARNIFDLRDTIADELKRGKWRNVVRADRPRAPPFSSEAVR